MKKASGIFTLICGLLRPNHKFLIQRHSENKSAYPGVWYHSASGHVSAGEDAKTSLIREAKKKLGLHLNHKNWNIYFHIKKRASISSKIYTPQLL